MKTVRTEPGIVPSPSPVAKISQDWVDELDVDAALNTEVLEDMDSDPSEQFAWPVPTNKEERLQRMGVRSLC